MAFNEYPCGACTIVIKQFDSIHEFVDVHAATAAIARAPAENMKRAANIQQWTIPTYVCNMDFSKAMNTDDRDGRVGALPGMSSFYLDRETGKIYHAYSSFMRGVEDLESYFGWIDRIGNNPDNKHRGHPFFVWPVDESGQPTANQSDREYVSLASTK